MDEKTLARFWSKVEKRGPDECWLWQASLDSRGYGHIQVNGRLALAHRVSYRLQFGALPPKAFVCHRCDVRDCVNPNHLFLGTAFDNMQDAKSKGRLKPPPQGVAHNRARLDPEKVREVRRLAAAGVSKAEIARRFRVWPRAIWMIIQGKSWKHVA